MNTKNPIRFNRKKFEAELLGITPRCLENWMRAKVVPFVKIKNVVLFDHERVLTALGRFEVHAK